MFLGTKTIKDLKDIKKSKHLDHISLFTGCGGLDVGFAQAGIITKVMIEWSKDACDTLRVNWTMEGHRRSVQARIEEVKKTWKGYRTKRTHQLPMTAKERDETIKKLEEWKERKPGGWYHLPEPVIMQRDITTVSVEEVLEAAKLKVGECGIVSGGFPCQGFSTAGPRLIDDPRNVLYKECVRMIKGILPKFFILENVRGLTTMDHGIIIDQICTDLAECGYRLSWNLINAADYGVPQNRVRVIMQGERNDVMLYPEKGNIQLHLGGSFGPVKHPDWFIKKYNIINKYNK